jgi:hypothetical protein
MKCRAVCDENEFQGKKRPGAEFYLILRGAHHHLQSQRDFRSLEASTGLDFREQ